MEKVITGVILAGGKGRRMLGQDKGLINFQGKPMWLHILQRLQFQVDDVAINANRNLDLYAQSGLSVFCDERVGFQGALSGMLTALKLFKTDYVLFVPCDNPFLPLNLAKKLYSALISENKNHSPMASYVYDGERHHPTFCLLSPQILPALSAYLDRGERKIFTFMQENHAIAVDFSSEKASFQNLNSLADLQCLEHTPRFLL